MKRPLHIAVTCYPTFGGSGIIATELGMALARRGHQIHFISSQLPWRLDAFADNVFFHEVEARDYPLFEQSHYALALASKMVAVAQRHALDLFHVHYAIPHSTAGVLARQILGANAPALVSTLHGTDITLVGSDPSFLPITRFSIEQSSAVSVPSAFLRDATYRQLGVSAATAIEVIPNFVDTDTYRPSTGPRPLRVVHNSNFRPLKRVDQVVEVFARVHQRAAARGQEVELVLIGDGPERSRVENMIHSFGLAGAVRLVGKQLYFSELLAGARAFLLCSESESFGLAALEALSCGVPVVAFDVGGLSEVVRHAETGMLMAPGDLDASADAIAQLLFDEPHQAKMAAAARADAVRRFAREPIVDQYEAYFRRVVG